MQPQWPDRLAVITTYFNPCGYRNIERNYFEFRERLGVPVLTMELSFDGRFVIEDAVRIRGDARNLLWQKERLLNLAIESLPDRYDRVAWLDADLLFSNRTWYRDTLEALERHEIVQLFGKARWLAADGRAVATWPSFAERRQSGSRERGHPGFAWAARREQLAEGLLETDLSGNGDLVMAHCWAGQWRHDYFGKLNSRLMAHFLQWGTRRFLAMRGPMGYVAGALSHLYHGKLSRRGYHLRLKRLVELGFDPARDLEFDGNGLWRWTDDAKPELVAFARDFFSHRKEDDA